MVSPSSIKQLYSLFRRAYGRYKWQIVFLAVLGFAAGLLEGVGINALIPLFSFALGGQGATDFISRQIANFFALFDLSLTVRLLLVFITVLFGAKALLTLLLDYLKLRIITNYEEEARRSLFEKILAANWTHLMRQKLGHLETMLAVDVTNAATLLGQVASVITVVTGLVIYVVIALNISAAITLITLGLGIVIFAVFRPILRRVRALATERNQIMKDTAHHVSENILGMKTVKAAQVGGAVAEKGRALFARLRRSTFRVPFLKSIMSSLTEPVAVIFVSLIFALTYQQPDFNLVRLIALVYLIQRMFLYIQQLQSFAHSINTFSPYLESVVRYEEEARKEREADLGQKPFRFSDSLKFANVSFGYSGDRMVLSDVSFTLKKGELTGLIGPSGVGKTTITDLLLRLLEPKEGQILLDGTDARAIQITDWRGQIGYMSQDIFLLNDTIANNIRFYDPHLTAKDIAEASHLANLENLIASLPQGYETVIGERGVRLSAGERQRVVLARVLARQPAILILDEATSALDNESEAQIQKALGNLRGRLTVLAIAHRLSTVKDCDKLLVLENGQLVEQGEPRALLADKNSYFFRTYNLVTDNK